MAYLNQDDRCRTRNEWMEAIAPKFGDTLSFWSPSAFDLQKGFRCLPQKVHLRSVIL